MKIHIQRRALKRGIVDPIRPIQQPTPDLRGILAAIKVEQPRLLCVNYVNEVACIWTFLILQNIIIYLI